MHLCVDELFLAVFDDEECVYADDAKAREVGYHDAVVPVDISVNDDNDHCNESKYKHGDADISRAFCFEQFHHLRKSGDDKEYPWQVKNKIHIVYYTQFLYKLAIFVKSYYDLVGGSLSAEICQFFGIHD